MPVVIGSGSHPFPFRTRKLSLIPPMVLYGKLYGRVGRCRHYSSRPDDETIIGPFLLIDRSTRRRIRHDHNCSRRRIVRRRGSNGSSRVSAPAATAGSSNPGRTNSIASGNRMAKSRATLRQTRRFVRRSRCSNQSTAIWPCGFRLRWSSSGRDSTNLRSRRER